MNQEIKDKFAELGEYIRDGGGSRRLVELLFMVEDAMIAPESDMVKIHISTNSTVEITKELHQEIQSLLDDEKKIPAIKALRNFFSTDNSPFRSSLGLKEAKDAVENTWGKNWNISKIIYKEQQVPMYPTSCYDCPHYTSHPDHPSQNVEDPQPEDLDPKDVLTYDPMGVGDESDPQDTINVDPQAEEEPFDVGAEDDDEGPIKRCCDRDAVLIFDETIICRPCQEGLK